MGHYVFVTVLVGFVSTFGVLKKTTNKETKKARNKPLDEEKVPTEEPIKVFYKNEMEMTRGNKANAEDETVNIESEEIVKIKESPEEELMEEAKVERTENNTTVQVDSEEAKEKHLESHKSEPMADVMVEISETSTAVEDDETKEKDIESQGEKPMSEEEKDGEEEAEDGKSKDDEECEKQPAKTNVKEDFLFTAAICSTWIPTVVGDQKQKIYLKAGMPCLIKSQYFDFMKHPGVTSLVTKTTFLAIAIILAGFGIHTKHPFLLHCIDETSPLFDESDTSITYCDFNETDTRWANCVPTEKDRNHTEKLAKLASTLEHLELAITNHGGETEWMIKSQVEKELSELQQNGTGRLVQKVRICGENENVYQMVILAILIVLIVSAALATVHLHRIADYRVGFYFSRSCCQYIHNKLFQNLFYASESIACGVKNSKMRVVHRSLLQEAVEDEDKDISFLKQVLEALKEKVKTEESKMKKVSNWMASKLCCGKADETEELLEANNEKETQESLQESLQKVEEGIIVFLKEVREGTEASTHQEVSKEVDEMRERIVDLKGELVGEKKSVAPLWDAPNEQGNTALHLSVKLKNPEATSLLLDFEVDPNVQDSMGKTPLHLACDQVDIEQATKLVKHKVLVIEMLFVCLIFILIKIY